MASKIVGEVRYSNSSMIVALSDGMKDGIVSTGFSAEKVEVIPNSCDLDLFSVELLMMSLIIFVL